MGINNHIIKRKCSCCHNTISICFDTIHEVIYYDKKSYHSKCFMEYVEKKIILSKQSNSIQKWQSVKNNINEIKVNSVRHFSYYLYVDLLYNFIRQQYGITVIPSVFWHKLTAVFDGSYFGISKAIPPQDLYDMWTRQIQRLNKIASKKLNLLGYENIGHRLNYDLAVLINKYDSYLHWKEHQKILKLQQNQQNYKEYKIDVDITNNLVNTYQKNQLTKEENNIESLVNDIF